MVRSIVRAQTTRHRRSTDELGWVLPMPTILPMREVLQGRVVARVGPRWFRHERLPRRAELRRLGVDRALARAPWSTERLIVRLRWWGPPPAPRGALARSSGGALSRAGDAIRAAPFWGRVVRAQARVLGPPTAVVTHRLRAVTADFSAAAERDTVSISEQIPEISDSSPLDAGDVHAHARLALGGQRLVGRELEARLVPARATGPGRASGRRWRAWCRMVHVRGSRGRWGV